MGKGTIISGGTDGSYQVQINYDRTALTTSIAAQNAKIAAYEIALAAETDEQKKNLISLLILSCEKRITYLNANTAEDVTQQAWCADLTEDLTGAVGTIEVPGESETILIQPGNGIGDEGPASYDAARDGQLVPTSIQTAAQLFYNLAMLPGWQKWMPTFRFGAISNIDTDANTATVTLESAVSSQQDINVNQNSILSGVLIDYMSCGAAAFTSGDSVLVEFTGQAFGSPKIIGFKSNPIECIEYWYATINPMDSNAGTSSCDYIVPDFSVVDIVSGYVPYTYGGGCQITTLQKAQSGPTPVVDATWLFIELEFALSVINATSYAYVAVRFQSGHTITLYASVTSGGTDSKNVSKTRYQMLIPNYMTEVDRVNIVWLSGNSSGPAGSGLSSGIVYEVGIATDEPHVDATLLPFSTFTVL